MPSSKPCRHKVTRIGMFNAKIKIKTSSRIKKYLLGMLSEKLEFVIIKSLFIVVSPFELNCSLVLLKLPFFVLLLFVTNHD